MSDDLYKRLGIRPFINCCGTRTVHGGSLMLPQVTKAMVEGSHRFVSLNEHILASGRRIAELTGAEAALVTSGGAASLVAAPVAAQEPYAWRDSLVFHTFSIAAIDPRTVTERGGPIIEAVRRTTEMLAAESVTRGTPLPLIGFAGAPFTLAAYLSRAGPRRTISPRAA